MGLTCEEGAQVVVVAGSDRRSPCLGVSRHKNARVLGHKDGERGACLRTLDARGRS